MVTVVFWISIATVYSYGMTECITPPRKITPRWFMDSVPIVILIVIPISAVPPKLTSSWNSDTVIHIFLPDLVYGVLRHGFNDSF